MSSSTTESKLSTIYYPLTANPAGHHHLLLAESVLWNFPETQLVVFLLSNGLHPDPLKQQQIPSAALRLNILQSALNDWSDPKKSLPAKIAEDSGIHLKLRKSNSAISHRELAINRPLRLAEHIKSFSGSEKVRMIVGADLLERMLNPQIFTDLDLVEIERSCHLLLAPRNEVEIVTILQHLMKKRGVNLSATLIKTERFTKNLQRFFLISSTIIRRAAKAGHDLTTFLPSTAALQLLQNSLYVKTRQPFWIKNSNLNELQLRCHELMEQLDEAAKQLQKLLNKRKIQKQPHRFSVVETSTGGQIAEGFTSCSGASKHFLDGRILYSQEAQKKFLRRSTFADSSVSQTRAQDLAVTMRKRSGADWALAETGMAGPPSSERRSKKNGQCHLGLALSSAVRYKCLEFNPFLTRKEHQLLFAIEALNWAENVLQN